MPTHRQVLGPRRLHPRSVKVVVKVWRQRVAAARRRARAIIIPWLLRMLLLLSSLPQSLPELLTLFSLLLAKFALLRQTFHGLGGGAVAVATTAQRIVGIVVPSAAIPTRTRGCG